MRYDRFYSKLFHEPLALDSGTFAALEHLLLNAMEGKLPAMPEGVNSVHPVQSRKITDNQRAARTKELYDPGKGPGGRTALIHIDGVLDRHLDFFSRLCFDVTDTADIQEALNEAARDNGTQNILLYINSPGGGIFGIPELFSQISALSQLKNVFAFTDSLCASAAYWIAAGCDQILATPSAVIGSIGVYCAVTDQSQKLSTGGTRVELIQSGDLKTAGHPAKPLSPDERNSIQDRVDEAGDMFRSDVKSKRPDVADDALQGQTFYGRSALSEGLIDQLVPDLAAAIAQFGD